MNNNYVRPNQEIYIDPFNAKLFDYNNVDSRVYLAQAINNLLRAYGNDFVIEGFKVLDIKYEIQPISNYDFIKLTIGPGRAVIDSTYIEVTETTYLVYDVTNLDDSGFIILSLDFNYLHTPYQNDTYLKLSFFNSAATNDNTLGIHGYNNNSNFFKETSKIILNKITFDKSNKKISSYIQNCHLFDAEKNKVILFNKEYIVYPKSPILKDFIRILEKYYL